MSFRARLVLILVLAVSASIGCTFFVARYHADSVIAQAAAHKALSIAASAAATLDGDKLGRLKHREQEKSPEYSVIEAQLRKIRDYNRRSDTRVYYLYTLTESPDKAGTLIFGVDPEEDIANKSHLGDVVRSRWSTAIKLHERRADPVFYTDEWGTWLTARFPVKDSSGKVVAAVAVDLARDDILVEEHELDNAILMAAAMGLVIALIGVILISRSASKPLLRIRKTIAEIAAGNLNPPVELQRSDEFGRVAEELHNMAKGLREREAVKSAFARFVSQHVLERVLTSEGEIELQGDRRRITVLFCDIRGFTTMSEKLPPEQVVSILNSYFERMVEVIFRNKGTLDKFMGDGLMAIFGAPLEDPYQEQNAVQAALEIQRELGELNRTVLEKHKVNLSVGIGINSGTAVVGNIGSSKRMEYTAIGDTINLASRLEAKTKELGSSILISEYTRHGLKGSFPFDFERHGSIAIRGREEEVVVYAVPQSFSGSQFPAN